MSFLTPISESSWNQTKARHLLNRAGFGIPVEKANELVRIGASKAVDNFVHFQQFPDDYPEPDWVKDNTDFQAIVQAARLLGEEDRKRIVQDVRRTERRNMQSLKGWWLKRMKETSRPLQEKLALFWHGHFATSAQKVRDARMNFHLNQVFRNDGVGDFKTLVLKVGQSPAMLQYLDNSRNVKGKPNENWARELMELFTLGIGNYTEKDIKEAARSFTGWTHTKGTFVKNQRQHDFGQKTFMGRTGNFNGEQIVDIIFEQPALSTFIPKKLWEFFAYEKPEAALLEELSQVFKANNFKIAPLLKAMFLSEAFYSPKALHNQIKCPIQLILGIFTGLDIEIFEDPMLQKKGQNKKNRGKRQGGQLLTLAMKQMGQELFLPPNVKGWPGNRAWVNTNTMLVRYNISSFLVNGVIPKRPKRLELDEMANALQQERIMKRMRNLLKRAPFDVTTFFRHYEGFTLGEVVDLLVNRFIGRPLDQEQRNLLIQSIQAGSEETVLSLQNVKESNLRALVHLILSAAEYQLC